MPPLLCILAQTYIPDSGIRVSQNQAKWKLAMVTTKNSLKILVKIPNTII